MGEYETMDAHWKREMDEISERLPVGNIGTVSVHDKPRCCHAGTSYDRHELGP